MSEVHSLEALALPATQSDRGIRLRLLDGFQLRAGGRSTVLPASGQVLVAFLALHDHPLERRYVAGSLWTDASEQRACGSLRAILWKVSRYQWPLIEARGTTLELAPEVSVDVRQMAALVRRMAQGSAELSASTPDELGLEAELLPGWYQDWVLVERERVRMHQQHGLELLCEMLTRADRYFEAVAAGLAAVRSEPLRESARRTLIGAHLAAGNKTEALRQYEVFRGTLERELGLKPSAQMEELARSVRQ